MYSDVDDIEVEDTSTILARRQREDELAAKMRELVSNFDKYLEDKEKRVAEDDEAEVDSLVDGLCESGRDDVRDGCTVDVATWKATEEVATRRLCFRAFSADSLTLSSLLEEGAPRCDSCEHLSGPGTWRQVLPHVEAFSHQMYVHRCPVSDVFPRFLFFAMSVMDDADAVVRFYHALCSCRFEPTAMLDDMLTVLYNWGFDEKILDYSLEANVELQRLKSKCGREAGGSGEAAAGAPEEKPTADSSSAPEEKSSAAASGGPEEKTAAAASAAPQEKPGAGVPDFPVSKLAVNNTLKYYLLRMPHLDVATQEEDKALAVLRAFAAALADCSLVYAGINLRPLLYKMLDRLNIETWSDEKYLKLVRTLHVRELSVFGQYAAVRALVDRPLRDDRSALKGCVAWAILQVLHGVQPDKVKYVTRLHPESFSKLPPGPVAYSQLSPKQLYLSLQMLGDCASSAARADADDPAFYGGLLRHVYRLQQDLPRMSVMDSNIIKCQLVHLDFFWKSLTNELLERQGRPNSLLSYMRDLLQH